MSDGTQERVADPIGEAQEQHSAGEGGGNPHEVARLAAAEAARALVLGEGQPVPSQEAAEPEEIPLDAPELLLAVHDHLLHNEPLLLVFAASVQIAPEDVGRALSILQGARPRPRGA